MFMLYTCDFARHPAVFYTEICWQLWWIYRQSNCQCMVKWNQRILICCFAWIKQSLQSCQLFFCKGSFAMVTKTNRRRIIETWVQTKAKSGAQLWWKIMVSVYWNWFQFTFFFKPILKSDHQILQQSFQLISQFFNWLLVFIIKCMYEINKLRNSIRLRLQTGLQPWGT